MKIVLLEVIHYPPRNAPYRVIDTPDPEWPAIEAAIRRLDRDEWPHVHLHAVMPVEGREAIDDLTVMGGRGEYSVFRCHGTDEIHYEDASRGKATIRIWESDQGSVLEERSLCNDVERVLAIARYYAERAELHPDATWVRW